MSARTLAVFAWLLAIAAPAQAQSLFNAAGIGLPMEALDGRARGMGSLGIGLPGAAILLPADPAAGARLLIPGGLIAAQPSWVDLTRDGSSEHRRFRGSRFPLLAAGYPFMRGLATIHATSFLDQGFQGERPVTVDLLGSPVAATDVFEQEGSVSMLALGYARMISINTGVGVSAGRYSGSVVRRLARSFADSANAPQAIPYGSTGSWAYHGYQVTFGVSTDVAGVVRVAASATASTELDAVANSETAGADRSFSVPLQLRIGASGQLAPGLFLAASASRADWSDTATDLGAGASAGSVTAFGVGLELTGGTLLGRSTPLRIGFRHSGLPFSLEAGDAHEQVFSAGAGFALNQTQDVILASLDLGVEKGSRVASTYQENFWRATVSLRVLGF